MSATLAACVLFLLPLPVAAQDLLQKAERAYRDGRYPEAHDVWVAALQDPLLAKGPILFNLGSCAYRMGQVPEAVLWWQRARLRAPRDAEIAFNLRRAEQELGLPPNPRPWSETLTQRELWALVLIAQAAGLLGLVLLRRRVLRIAGVVLALATLPGAITLLDPAAAPQERGAIVLGRTALLRSEPHADLPRLAPLPPGTRVRILAASERWVWVAMAGERGWVERAQLGFID